MSPIHQPTLSLSTKLAFPHQCDGANSRCKICCPSFKIRMKQALHFLLHDQGEFPQIHFRTFHFLLSLTRTTDWTSCWKVARFCSSFQFYYAFRSRILYFSICANKSSWPLRGQLYIESQKCASGIICRVYVSYMLA